MDQNAPNPMPEDETSMPAEETTPAPAEGGVEMPKPEGETAA